MKHAHHHDGEVVIQASDLSVSRGGTIVLDNINLTIRQGDFVALVGPNGSGKTTLVMAILGLLQPTKGTVEILGRDSKKMKFDGKIGWVSQAAANLPKNIRITVRELVTLGVLSTNSLIPFRGNKKDTQRRVDEALQIVGLQDVADVDIYRLSGGQRQRAVIGRALASNPEILVFDEPLVGVDRASRNSLLKLLDELCHKENKTLLMVSHDLPAIRQSAHRVIYLDLVHDNDCCSGGIHYDGPTDQFPDLVGLAALRGIRDVHEEVTPVVINPSPVVVYEGSKEEK
jgi:zinc transport system ATP-binding protein